MKMYHFNPNSHGLEYFIMAENKNKALESLINHFKEQMKICTTYKSKFKLWKKVKLDVTPLPYRYTIDEYEAGQIVETEIS